MLTQTSKETMHMKRIHRLSLRCASTFKTNYDGAVLERKNQGLIIFKQTQTIY